MEKNHVIFVVKTVSSPKIIKHLLVNSHKFSVCILSNCLPSVLYQIVCIVYKHRRHLMISMMNVTKGDRVLNCLSERISNLDGIIEHNTVYMFMISIFWFYIFLKITKYKNQI